MTYPEGFRPPSQLPEPRPRALVPPLETGGAEGLRTERAGSRLQSAALCSGGRGGAGRQAGAGQLGSLYKLSNKRLKARVVLRGGGASHSIHNTLQSSFSVNLFLGSFGERRRVCLPIPPTKDLGVRGPIAEVQVDFRKKKGLDKLMSSVCY